ncbi:MAG: HAD family hydrolase [Kiritimatiellia bacterium]
MKGKTSAVLFDLDGTLVDSLQDIAASMNQVLTRRGFPEHPVEAYRFFVGDGMEMLARRCLPAETDISCSLIEDLVREMKETYATQWRNHPDPYPGIREMLRGLTRAGLRLGVFSNKPESFTREMVFHVFGEEIFETVRGAREGVPVKPAPDGARAILAAWGLKPEQVLYVGDTNTDMATGKNTGMFTVGVTWGFRDRQELEAGGADGVVDHPDEILRMFA